MTFIDFLKANLTAAQYEQLSGQFRSKNRCTFVLANPDKASAEELLMLSEVTGLSLSILISQSVATSTLSDREINYYSHTNHEQNLSTHTQDRPNTRAKELAGS